jgi:8-amino-7-oxononanoate synthase
MTDVFDKCRSWTEFCRRMRRDIAWPYNHAISAAHENGAEVTVGGRRVVMAGSNDYLGLAADPRVQAAAIRAVERFGTSCSGSRLHNGSRTLHEELEHRLAAFLGRDAAVVVPTGFQTNLGVAVLFDRHDVVFGDRRNHASLVDSARLGFGAHRRYHHSDMADLERLLAAEDRETGKLIVTEGMFSVDGDLCDLPGIVDLAGRYDARVMVDCAHDLGLLGARGRGVPEHFGLEAAVDLVTGTFSKCLASAGGVIAGPAHVIDYLRYQGRSIIFSAAGPPPAVAAALAALDIAEREPERRRRVLDLAEKAHDGLRALGFDTGASVTPVVPVRVSDDLLCLRLASELLDAGVFVNAFIEPATAPGQALVRLSMTAAHTDAHLDRVFEAFTTVGRRLGVIPATPPPAYEPVVIARPPADSRACAS